MCINLAENIMLLLGGLIPSFEYFTSSNCSVTIKDKFICNFYLIFLTTDSNVVKKMTLTAYGKKLYH